MLEVLSHLNKVKDDRKIELYKTFHNHMDEIRKEREMIMKLVLPTFSVSGAKLTESCNASEVLSKKRKSSETTLDPTKLSPVSKRVSRDSFEKFLLDKGFSTDLNKLNKGNLISLLESRGITSFKMKHLKADMVDALKACFTENAVSESDETQQIATEVTTSSAALIPPNHAECVRTPGRKVSLMADFRDIVNGTGVINALNADDLKDQSKIKKEFQNRLSRHRESQIRKSISAAADDAKELKIADSDSLIPVKAVHIDTVAKTQPPIQTWAEIGSPGSSVPEIMEVKTSTEQSHSDHTSSVTNENSKKLMPHTQPERVKPVTMSFEKAKQAKALEEQKLLLKKKEQEQKSISTALKKEELKPAKKGFLNMFNGIKSPAKPVASSSSTIPPPATFETSCETESKFSARTSEKVEPAPPSSQQENLREETKHDSKTEGEVIHNPPSQSSNSDASKVEYTIDDRDDSDEGSSDTDDETEKKDKPEKPIPEWARGEQLRQALERQYGLNGCTPMDPDKIFPEVQTCNLEEIFGKREDGVRNYACRTSSAHWEPDELTIVEKRQYRVHMGYDHLSSFTKIVA